MQLDLLSDRVQSSWEAHATVLANAETDQALVEAYNKLATDLKVNQTAPARVIFARDTRASGSRLAGCLIDALEATGTESTDYKILTTPQLHYLVRCVNTKGTAHAYGEVSEKGYYEKMSAAFKKALKYRTIPDDAPEDKGVIVDCANGVGGPKLRELLRYLPSPQDKGVKIKVVNEDVHKPENLNSQVCFLWLNRCAETKNLDSVVQTSSRPASGLLRHPRPSPWSGALRSMAMLTV